MGGIFWMATDGLYWQAPTGLPAACDWQYLAVCTGNSAAAAKQEGLLCHRPGLPTYRTCWAFPSDSSVLLEIKDLALHF